MSHSISTIDGWTLLFNSDLSGEVTIIAPMGREMSVSGEVFRAMIEYQLVGASDDIAEAIIDAMKKR